MCNICKQAIFLHTKSAFIFKKIAEFFFLYKNNISLQKHQKKFVATLTQVRLNVLLVVLNLFTLLMVYLHARPEGTAIRQQEEL
jgi:hypothetical protein